MSLDTIYAITATPPKQVGSFKRDVKKVSNSNALDADSHEAPQSQLPPNTSIPNAAISRPNTNQAQPADTKSPARHIDIEV